MNVSVVDSGMINAVGVGTGQVSAAVQAGVCLYQESNLISSKGVPYKMASVPTECLSEVGWDVPLSSIKGRYRRLLSLAISALKTISEPVGPQTPLYLALPERLEALPFAALEPMLKDLHQLMPTFNLEKSKVFPCGRASGATALRSAVDAIESGEPFALVGGVDTYMDLAVMNRLRMDKRLLTPLTNQGFVPGEGAAFVLLSGQIDASLPQLVDVATAEEPAHIYSGETCKGEGLFNVIQSTCANLQETVKTVYCGLNGENIAIKEWGIAASKSELSQADFQLHHPAENYGDLGAATIPTLLALSAQRLLEKPSSGPYLVWASSDYALRGAVTLTL